MAWLGFLMILFLTEAKNNEKKESELIKMEVRLDPMSWKTRGMQIEGCGRG